MKKISIKKNFIYMLLYRIVVTLTPLLTTPYVVRILSPADLGNFNYAESVDAYFAAVAVLGCITCGQREIAICRDDRTKYSTVFWEIMLVRVFLCLAVIAVYLVCIKLFFSPALQLIYVVLAIGTIGGILDITWLYQGLENFSSVFWRNLVTRLSSIILIFLLVKEQNDFYTYVIINTAALFIGNFTLWIRIRDVVDFIPPKQLKPVRWIIPVIVLFLPTVASTIYHRLDVIMIGSISGDPIENAYYGQSLKICTICKTTVATISSVVAPRLTYTAANKTKAETNYYLGKALEVLFLIGLPMSVGIMAIADILIPWFLGEIYTPSILVLRYLAVLCLVSGLNGLFGSNYLIATKRHNRYSATIMLGCLINFAANYTLIPVYAAKGAAIASLISECAILILILAGIVKEVSFKEVRLDMLKISFSGLIMGITTYWFSCQMVSGTKNIILLISWGIFAYGALLVLFREKMVVDYLKKGKAWLTHYGSKR